MNLLNLAPDIQEEILFLPRVVKGRVGVTESELRAVCAVVDWARRGKAANELELGLREPAEDLTDRVLGLVRVAVLVVEPGLLARLASIGAPHLGVEDAAAAARPAEQHATRIAGEPPVAVGV